jgi:pimeloyl-ACP methyl ester carboxylesterase
MFFQNYVDPISPKMSKKSSTFNVETKEGYIISGTLVMPQAEVEQPNVVLIIAGSGPTDRNGNGLGLGTNAYAMLADSLSEAGIASVRFDKRGIALSQNDVQEKDTKFDDFVTDVISFVKKIKASKKFGEIYIAGHSEGSLIGMIAANKEPIDGLISIAGAAEPAQKLLAKQLSSKNMPGNSLQEALEILKKLEKGEMVTELQNKNLLTLFRESVQPYLISWFSYDPIVEFQKLSCKILIINGDRDVQVADSSAKMLQEANAKAKLFIIPGMNHVLKDVGDDQELAMKSYNAPTIPLSKELSRKIIDFCK